MVNKELYIGTHNFPSVQEREIDRERERERERETDRQTDRPRVCAPKWKTPRNATYSDGVNEVHVGFDGQLGVLDLHQFREGHRQLDHLAEVDVDVVDPVRQRRVQQDQVLQMHAPTNDRDAS